MARCLARESVRAQIAAHYPQARISQVAPEDDPLRLRSGEQAWAMDPEDQRPRVRSAAHLRRRRSPRPRLRPHPRPDRRAVRPRGGRARRDPAAAAFPRPRLVPGPPGDGQPQGCGGAPAVLPRPTRRSAADGRQGHGRSRRRGRSPPSRRTSGCRRARAGRPRSWPPGSQRPSPPEAGRGGASGRPAAPTTLCSSGRRSRASPSPPRFRPSPSCPARSRARGAAAPRICWNSSPPPTATTTTPRARGSR